MAVAPQWMAVLSVMGVVVCDVCKFSDRHPHHSIRRQERRFPSNKRHAPPFLDPPARQIGGDTQLARVEVGRWVVFASLLARLLACLLVEAAGGPSTTQAPVTPSRHGDGRAEEEV